jgi:hypothetical protein
VSTEQVMDVRKHHFFEEEFQKIFIVGAAELMGAFIIHPCLPFVGVITHSRASSLHGHYAASPLLLAPPPPSRLSTEFLVLPVIRLPCFRRFLDRDE